MSEPVERLVVSFFGHPCLTVRASDGSIYVSLGDLCDLIGLRTAAQARRLRNDPDLADGLVRFRAATAGGVQAQDFLLLEHVPIWIGSVNRNKAAPDVQEQIGYLRRRIVREVYAAFAREAGLPEGSSRQIEDLQDLDRFDDALSRLADQQRSLEQSMRQDHDQSQRELRQFAARVKALEERIGGTITRERVTYRSGINTLGRVACRSHQCHHSALVEVAKAGEPAVCWSRTTARFR